MKLFSIRFVLFWIIIFVVSGSALAQKQDIQIETFIEIDEKQFAEFCSLYPSGINAHYKYAPNQARKNILQTSNTDITVDFVSNCGGQAWPEEAKTAMQYAADIWESHLESSIPIRIEANWAELGSGTLASAGPTLVFTLTGGDAVPNTFYTIAQASALTGSDLAAEFEVNYDIVVDMNCTRDNWYFGTDANTPTGTYDAVTVLLHEIGHGVGFIDSFNGEPSSQIADWGVDSGQNDLPLIFDIFVLDGLFDQLTDQSFYPKPSSQLYDALTGRVEGVFFSGIQAEFALDNMRIPLFAPDPFRPGSSTSHFDQQFFSNTPNALMRPNLDLAFSVHSPGPVFCGLLDDIGWPLGQDCIDLLPDEGFLNRPFLTFPENGSYDTILNPTLMWQAVAGAEEYRIQLAADYNFENMIADRVISGTSFDVQGMLDFSTLYFWRVQAIGVGGNSKFSSKYRFTTTISPPDAIVLLQPDDNAINLRPGFSFVWQASGRADEYQIQVAGNPGFSSPVIDAAVSVPRYLNTSSLNFSTMYYWRVRGLNSAGPGDWSEVRTFSTIIEKPDPVTLISPSENENQVSVSATLNWSESSRASEYIIQVSQNEGFPSGEVIQLTSSEPMLTLSNPLEFATIYYWRVKATNIGGESDWSEANQFTTVVRETAIKPNYPNPFNSTTTIRFQLSENSDVTLDIFDSVGRRVSVLVDEERAAGVYFEQLQAARFASGTYFIRIIAGDFMEVQKMAIIK